MPAMTAREFADTIAVPTVEDFMRDPCQRRGYLACLAVYHAAEYLKPVDERWARDVHKTLEDDLGRPFLALQRMADAVKHREKREGKGQGVILMQSGSDTKRPVTGFDISGFEDMNPGDGKPGNPLRFDDLGGRFIEDDGRFYDMLDLCVIVLQAYARLYPAELTGSLIDGIRYSTATYPKV